MPLMLSLGPEIHDQLLRHLRDLETEQVAFLFTDPPSPKGPLKVHELYRVPAGEFDLRSAFHVTLADSVRKDVIRRAWELGGCIVEAHSHLGGDPAAFSYSDLLGLEEWVPHVRWRLRAKPYVALVFADDTFDALVWEGGRRNPQALKGLQIYGGEIQTPTGLTYKRLAKGSRDG